MAVGQQEVDLVLGHRVTTENDFQYLVQWASDQGQTWEQASSLTDCAELLGRYWRRHVTTQAATYLVPMFENIEPAETSAPKKQRKVPQKATRRAQLSGNDTVDRIAVAKRTQAAKRLRTAQPQKPKGGSMVSAPIIKPPPVNAKRAAVVEISSIPSPLTEAASKVAGLSLGSKPAGVQRARKSTGGRRIGGRPPKRTDAA